MTEKIAFANGLRGIAAGLVVFSHLGGVYWGMRDVVAAATAMPPLPELIVAPAIVTAIDKGMWPLQAGPLGVSIFFLISGFVIPFSFAHFDRVNFAIARFFRIWPTYFASFLLAVLFVFFLSRTKSQTFPFSLFDIAVHSVVGLRDLVGARYIDNVLWSLEVELRFYVLAAIAGGALWRTKSAWVFAAPALLFVASAVVFSMPSSWPWLNAFCRYNCYVVYMFIGVAFNFYARGAFSMPTTILTTGTLCFASGLLLHLYIPSLLGPIWPSYVAAIVLFAVAQRYDFSFWTWRPIRSDRILFAYCSDQRRKCLSRLELGDSDRMRPVDCLFAPSIDRRAHSLVWQISRILKIDQCYCRLVAKLVDATQTVLAYLPQPMVLPDGRQR